MFCVVHRCWFSLVLVLSVCSIGLQVLRYEQLLCFRGVVFESHYESIGVIVIFFSGICNNKSTLVIKPNSSSVLI